MDYKDKIIKALAKATGLLVTDILLEKPENAGFGDYTTNVALQSFQKVKTATSAKSKKHLNKALGDSPRQMAENVKKLLETDKELEEVVEKVDIAGPGFINFFLKNDLLIDTLLYISSHKDTFGYSDYLKGKKIMFEYGDANTHKLPHIGHLFSYTYGESMSRILSFAGAEVKKACYQGDIGMHVAKCLWAFRKEDPKVPDSLEDKVQLLQELYQKGSAAFDASEDSKKEITDLNKAIYDRDKSIVSLWKETRQWSIDYYKKFEDKLNIKYDRYYYESEVYKKGQGIVEENVGKVFTKSEGALIFEGSKYGLHDRVFVTKYGTPTYEAKDMYLQKLKFAEWPMDLCIITTANEQNGYFQVVFKALEKLDSGYVGKLKHIGFGMINLKSGKMSSRTGEIIGAIDVVSQVMELAKKQNPDIDVSQMVAVAAIKYSFLKNNPLQNITFDVNDSVAKEGNSGPYLQYTYARTQSVLSKTGSDFKGKGLSDKSKVNLNTEESTVLRLMVHFSDIVRESAEKYAPNLLCMYLYELAQKFNTFYNAHKIIGSDDEEIRVGITAATGTILKNGLALLGIETPERM